MRSPPFLLLLRHVAMWYNDLSWLKNFWRFFMGLTFDEAFMLRYWDGRKTDFIVPAYLVFEHGNRIRTINKEFLDGGYRIALITIATSVLVIAETTIGTIISAMRSVFSFLNTWP